MVNFNGNFMAIMAVLAVCVPSSNTHIREFHTPVYLEHCQDRHDCHNTSIKTSKQGLNETNGNLGNLKPIQGPDRFNPTNPTTTILNETNRTLRNLKPIHTSDRFDITNITTKLPLNKIMKGGI